MTMMMMMMMMTTLLITGGYNSIFCKVVGVHLSRVLSFYTRED